MKLAEYLRAHKIRQTQFALLLGGKPSTLHGWITGRRMPELAVAIQIQEITNGLVRPEDFVRAAEDRRNAKEAA